MKHRINVYANRDFMKFKLFLSAKNVKRDA